MDHSPLGESKGAAQRESEGTGAVGGERTRAGAVIEETPLSPDRTSTVKLGTAVSLAAAALLLLAAASPPPAFAQSSSSGGTVGTGTPGTSTTQGSKTTSVTPDPSNKPGSGKGSSTSQRTTKGAAPTRGNGPEQRGPTAGPTNPK